MARVVVVHGIAQQFRGPATLLEAVGPALSDGVRLALDPEAASPIRAGDVACAFYGDVFLRPGTRASGSSVYEPEDVERGLESELLLAWWGEASRTDPAVVAPDAVNRGVAGYLVSRSVTVGVVRRALNALAHSAFFGGVTDSLLIFGLKQVRRYFGEPELRYRIRARVAAEIGPDTRVVVGHSLGSVVAYETLCDPVIRQAHPDWRVQMLVTLGSPLGVRGLVFDRLEPLPADGLGAWPPGLEQWANVADNGDVVALAKELAQCFGPRVVDHLISNGTRMHDMTRYLLAPKTGAAIAAGLAG